MYIVVYIHIQYINLYIHICVHYVYIFYMHVAMDTYANTCLNQYKYVHAIHTKILKHIHRYVCLHACVFAYICICIHEHTHTRVSIYIYVIIYIYILIHICIYTCVCLRAHMRKNPWPGQLPVWAAWLLPYQDRAFLGTQMGWHIQSIESDRPPLQYKASVIKA